MEFKQKGNPQPTFETALQSAEQQVNQNPSENGRRQESSVGVFQSDQHRIQVRVRNHCVVYLRGFIYNSNMHYKSQQTIII